MDIITLGLAKKYTNKKIKEAVFDGAMVLDSTLTKTGSAAEARAVGDKIKEVEAKIPKSVSELENDAGFITAKTQMQADWNQNDPNAPDYVKNRTHYMYMDEHDVTVDFEGVGMSGITDADLCQKLFEQRESLTMTIYGKAMSFINVVHTDNPNWSCEYYIADSGGPCYMYTSNDGQTVNVVTDGGSPLPVKITYRDVVETAHPLDEKFIPDTIARKADILTEERVLQLIEENYPAAEEVSF